jgi:hypothetical protein
MLAAPGSAPSAAGASQLAAHATPAHGAATPQPPAEGASVASVGAPAFREHLSQINSRMKSFAQPPPLQTPAAHGAALLQQLATPTGLVTSRPASAMEYAADGADADDKSLQAIRMMQVRGRCRYAFVSSVLWRACA